jgi:hypothetical protein
MQQSSIVITSEKFKVNPFIWYLAALVNIQCHWHPQWLGEVLQLQ